MGRISRTTESEYDEVILAKRQWPSWWAWELELTSHVLKRMADRGFNEVDLRRMLEHASDHAPDIVAGRFVIEARHGGHGWAVILEPDDARQLLVVVTAYPVEEAQS